MVRGVVWSASRCVIVVGIRPWARFPDAGYRPRRRADQGRDVVLSWQFNVVDRSRVNNGLDTEQGPEPALALQNGSFVLVSSRRAPTPLSSPVLYKMPPPGTVEAARARLSPYNIIQIIKQQRRTERVSCGRPTQCIQNVPRKSQPRNARPAQSRVKM